MFMLPFFNHYNILNFNYHLKSCFIYLFIYFFEIMKEIVVQILFERNYHLLSFSQKTLFVQWVLQKSCFYTLLVRYSKVLLFISLIWLVVSQNFIKLFLITLFLLYLVIKGLLISAFCAVFVRNNLENIQFSLKFNDYDTALFTVRVHNSIIF